MTHDFRVKISDFGAATGKDHDPRFTQVHTRVLAIASLPCCCLVLVRLVPMVPFLSSDLRVCMARWRDVGLKDAIP